MTIKQEQRITELTENGQRLLEAADGWKQSAQYFQQKRNDLEVQLERQIVQNNRDAERFRECLAENSELREDAERYRWFRLQGLWTDFKVPTGGTAVDVRKSVEDIKNRIQQERIIFKDKSMVNGGTKTTDSRD